LQILRAVVALDAYELIQRSGGVRVGHVRFFGVPECVTDVSLETIRRHVRWLELEGYVEATRVDGVAREMKVFRPTPKGRAWALC